MYSIFEILFFILYFSMKAVRFTLFLLMIQIVVYKVSGFSIYKFIMNKFYLFAFSEALCPAILPNVVVIEIDDPLAGYSL